MQSEERINVLPALTKVETNTSPSLVLKLSIMLSNLETTKLGFWGIPLILTSLYSDEWVLADNFCKICSVREWSAITSKRHSFLFLWCGFTSLRQRGHRFHAKISLHLDNPLSAAQSAVFIQHALLCCETFIGETEIFEQMKKVEVASNKLIIASNMCEFSRSSQFSTLLISLPL